jgi:hypothetical protein
VAGLNEEVVVNARVVYVVDYGGEQDSEDMQRLIRAEDG